VLYELQWQLLLVLHTHVGSDYWASNHGKRYTAATTAAATAAAAAASAEYAAQRAARIAAAATALHSAMAHSRTAAATQLLTEAACTAVLDATCEHFISAAARAAGVCVTAERRITARVTSDTLDQLLEQCAQEAVHAARCKAQTAQLQAVTAAAAAAVAQTQAAEAATAAAALATAEAALTELLAEAAVTSLTAAVCETVMTEAVRTVVTQHSGAQLVAELDARRCDALSEVVLQQSSSVVLEALLHAALRELSCEDEFVATAQLLVQRRIAAKAGAAVQKQLDAAAAIERAATKLQAMVRAYWGRRAMRAVIAARFVKLFDSDSGLWYWHDTMTSASFWEKPAIVSKFFKPRPRWAGPYKAIA
jgi:trimeric autotransporter adhesin